MTPDNPKIQALLALGKPKDGRDWPDYIKLYHLDADDVPSLLALYRDDQLHAQSDDEAALWAGLHAWRALGQLQAGAAIEPIVASFDTMFEDDYAMHELCKVMAMLGSSAIEPLWRFWQQPGRDEFAYVMAMDSLYEIASAHPHSRDRVIAIYRDYMARPFEALVDLNGLLISRLVDLGASELIDDIRRLFARNCVDISCAGDLEEVEILLGLRDQRSTPKPNYSAIAIDRPKHDDFPEATVPDDDDIYGVIDYWLMRYGHDDSILDVSEMDGYFAAIACAPERIMASSWIPAIWGGEQLAPQWQSETHVNQFCSALLALYNTVVEDLRSGEYHALLLENPNSEPATVIVDEWCEGFLRGVCLWGGLSAADSAILDTCLKPIKLFTSEHSSDYRMSIDARQVDALQSQIEPAVSTLYRHFFKTSKKASTTYVHSAPKVSRNAPCPCGSGKKYKKCCGLN